MHQHVNSGAGALDFSVEKSACRGSCLGRLFDFGPDHQDFSAVFSLLPDLPVSPESTH